MTYATRIQDPPCRAVELEIESLRSPFWILRPLDDAFVSELARSIEGIGLLQPIVVRKCESGFEVVFGSHRLEACRRIGIKKIPAFVTEFNEHEAFLARVSENLLRNTAINPIEEAEGYKRLLNDSWTINAIGKKIGKSDSYVCERLALIERLDHKIRDEIKHGSKYLTPTHLELLSKIKDVFQQRAFARLVEKKRLSVRALENMINGVPSPATIMPNNLSGECCIKIPDEFSRATGIAAGKPVRIHVRGKKLVIENAKSHKRRNLNPQNHPIPPMSQGDLLIRVQNVAA